MSFRTNALKVQAFAGAMYGIQVGTTTMAQINADITSAGSLSNALNGYYTSSFGSVANATVATTVATNLGLTGDALTSGAAYITAQLNAASAGERGAVISNILDLFAGLASDATFGAFATAYNTKVDAAVAYTGTANVAIGTVVADSDLTFTITADTSVYTGGTGDDTFTGAAGVIDGATINAGAGDDSLTLSLSDADDGSSFVATGLENMTVRLLSSATAGVAIDLSEVTGLETLTARRVSDAETTATLADLTFENIQDTDVVLTMQTISADGIIVEFDFDNTVVTGTADSVTLQIDSVTATATAASAWIDGDIETINVVAVGEGNVLSLQAAGADTLVVSGGEIEFASALSANIVSVDASANTGGVTLELGTATASVAVTGGDGDDSIDASAVTAATVVVDGGDGDDSLTLVATQIVEGLSFTGGDGTDTLTVSVTTAVAAATTTTTGAVIDGVETIALVIDNATAAVDLGAFRDISGVETIEVSFDTANAIGALAIDGLDGQSIEINFAGAATSVATNTTATITATIGATTTTTSTADVLSVSVANSATATTGTAGTGDASLFDLAVTLNIDGVETINLSGDSAAGGLDVTLVADALETLNVAAAAAMTVSLTAAAITDVVLTGAGDVTLAATVADFDVDASDLTGGLTYVVDAAAAVAADVIVITGGSGDDAITVQAGRYTVDLGAGDDTLSLSTAAAADLTSRDSFNGGDGTDTVELTLAAGGNDLNLVGFEVLALSSTGTTATATIDRLTSLTSIQVDASSTAAVVIQDLAVSSINLDVTALERNSSLDVALLDDTDTDTAAIVIAGTATTTTATISVGAVTLNGFDTISLDLTITDESIAATTTVISASANIEAISSDSAVSFVLTGDDDNLNQTVAMTLDLADGAVIDLTGFGGNIGTASGAITTTATNASETITYSIAGNGLILNGANSYTVKLGDESGAEILIDFGVVLTNTGTATTGLSAENEGADIIEFVDLGDTDDIGSVVIVNFNDRTNFSLSQASVIDLSDLSVTGLSELDITGTADAVITFDDLTGSITLVGVNSADLTAANFIFA